MEDNQYKEQSCDMSLTRKCLLWLLPAIFFAYQFMLRVMPNAISMEIISKFGITATEFSTFVGVFYIAYTLAHIPLGILVDKIGTKIICSFSMLVISITTVMIIFCDDFAMLFISRTICGAASSAMFLSLVKASSNYFPKHFGLALGIGVGTGFIGAFCGGYPIYKIFEIMEWNNAILLISMPGFILSIIFFILSPNTQKSENNKSLKISKVLKNKEFIFLIIAGGLMIGPMEGFVDTWSKIFFETCYSLTPAQSTYLPSLIFIGVSIATPLVGYLIDRGCKIYTLLNIFCISMLICFIVLLGFPSILNIYLIVCIMLIIGFCLTYRTGIIISSCRKIDSSLSGLIASLTNVGIMGFGPLFHLSIGSIIDYTNSSQGTHSAYLYEPSSLIMGLSVIPVGMICSLLILNVMKYTSSKQ